ncbi:MAG: outer membrane protein assembly factor BamA [Candidatus Krumholzibacteriota bacterium]|nr:outer membrane protein assembly factor BamA [Candidatus Krumholzibacteriota bacterium]
MKKTSFLLAVTLILISFFSSNSMAIVIGDVEIEGNVYVSAKEILLICGLKPGEEYEAAKVSQGLKRLVQTKNFSDIEALYSEEEGEAVITLRVEEYPRISKIRVLGNEKIETSEIRGKLRLREGLFARPEAISRDVMSIEEMYGEKGYNNARARVEKSNIKEEHKVELEYRIFEGEKVKISHIDFIGNGAIESDELRDIIETSEEGWISGGEFKPKIFEEDLGKIEKEYADMGYIEAEAKLYKKVQRDDGEHIDIFIKIDEGRKFYAGDITWSGNNVISDSKISRSIMLKKGEPFSIAMIENTQMMINSLYWEKGYIWSRITPSQTLDGRKINLELLIEENEQARINEIKISGNTKTYENVIRRELDIYPGDLFVLKDVQRSVREVFQSGYFKEPPKLDPKKINDEGDINLLLSVEEKQTGNFKLGFGFSQLNKLSGFIGLSENNLFGRGKNVSINWEFGKYRKNLNVQYSEPHLFNSETALSVSVFNWVQDRIHQQYYTDRRKGFSLQLGHPMPVLDYTRILLGYRFEQVELSNFDEAYPVYGTLRNVQWPMNKSTATLTIVRNSTDNPFHPTKGSISRLSAELAGGPLLGNVKFIRYKAGMSWFRNLFWKFTFHLDVDAGLIDGYGGSVVEDFEKFRLGGNRTYPLRGYDYYRVVPEGNDPYVGGRFMVKYTQEIVFPFSRQIHGLLFFDSGNTWNSFREANPFNLRRGLGVGVRVEIPGMGNLGLDYGYGFDKEGGGSWEPHFNFGTFF